ncbi:MAG: hypothetical protein QOH69_1243 [Actinomycetota bacterium]|jgi:hypothetical protein|nr:hypothetical protein [Actinomycetota bacterium]
MTESLDLLAQAEAALRRVALVDRSTLSDDELIAHLKLEESVGRFIDTSRVLTAGEVAERSRYELGAAGLSMRLSERKSVNFIEQVTRTSHAEASRRVRVGLAVRPRQSMLGEVVPPERPIVAEALRHGAIGVDTAATILCSLQPAAGGPR